jgi:hypothetical protein
VAYFNISVLSRNSFYFAVSLGVKQPGREADHSPPSSAKVRECVELYLHSAKRLYGMVLSIAQGQL